MARIRRSDAAFGVAQLTFSRLQDHRRLRRVAIAVLAVCVLWGAGTWYLGRPDIRVEHTVRHAAPARLSDQGPVPGGYRQAWRVTVPAATGDEPEVPSLVGGHLVVRTDDGIRAHDARTGRLGWHYREPGGELADLVATDDAIVAEFTSAAGSDWYSHAVGLDAGTGERLWESSRLSPRSDLDVAPRAGVVTVETDDGDWLGIDARTGKKRWRVTRSDVTGRGCRPSPGEGGRGRSDVIAVTFSCTDLPRPDLLATVDAASGELLWTRPATVDTQWDVEGGLVLYRLAEHDPPTLLARTGRPLFAAPTGAECFSACLASTGGRAIVRYRVDERPRLTTVDLGTGAVRTRSEPGAGPFHDADAAYDVAGGRLFVQTPGLSSSLPQVFVPAGVAVVDTADGDVTHAPLPFANRSFEDEDDVPVSGRLTGVAGGRLFSIRQTARQQEDGKMELASYISSGAVAPVELGGTSAEDWPDACRLLRGAPETNRGRPHTEIPVEIGRSTLRRWSCDTGDSGLQVRWVAQTTEQAATLFGADAKTRTLTDGTKLLRVGRVIVSLSTNTSVDPDAVTRAVVENLRAWQR